MQRAKYILTTLLTCVLLFGVLIPTAIGQTPSSYTPETPDAEVGPSFVLRPHDGQDGSFFTVNAEAGTTTELTAVLGNAGTEPIDLHTFSSDAVVLVNGGFGVSEEDAEQSGATTWVDWPAETISFEPGEGIARSFTVTIPDDAEPGEYITGISLETAEPIEVPGSTMFDQVIRKAVAVFIVVDGDTSASFELGDPEVVTTSGGSRLEVPVQNTGDVLVQPGGSVTLTDDAGNEVFSAEVSMGSVYAGMDTRLSIPLDASLAGQDYEVAISLRDESTQEVASAGPQRVEFSGEIAVESTVQIEEAAIIPMPEADDPVYVDVNLSISNTGEDISNANIVLHTQRDGEQVEEFVLGTNMTIAPGDTIVTQRYIPAGGFTEGEWSFSITIERVSDQSTSKTQVIHEVLPDTVTVP